MNIDKTLPDPPEDSLQQLDMVLGLDEIVPVESEKDPAAVSQSTALPDAVLPDANFRVVGDTPRETMNEGVANIPAESEPVRTAPRKRARFSYAKRRILADRSLFIKDDEVMEWRLHKGTNWDKHRIRGRIVGCPSRRNANTYTMEWNTEDLQGIDPTWVTSTVQATAKCKEALREAAELFDKTFPTETVPRAKVQWKATVGRTLPSQADSPNPTATERVTTPPTEVRAQAAANLATCARSFASSVSSLTQGSSTRLPNVLGYSPSGRRNRPRRQEPDDAYDSDKDLSQSEGDDIPEEEEGMYAVNDRTEDESDNEEIPADEDHGYDPPDDPRTMYDQCCCLK